MIYILNEYNVMEDEARGAQRVVATRDKQRLRRLVHENWPAEDQEWHDEAAEYLSRLIDDEELSPGSIDLHDEDWDCRIQLHVVVEV